MRWLAYEAAAEAFLASYAAIVLELEWQADEEGDAAAFGRLRRVSAMSLLPP